MINNDGLSFNVDEFVESLQNLEKTSHAEPKLPLREALASGKFVKADLGFRKTDDHSIWQVDTDESGQQFIIRTDTFDVPREADWSASANRFGDCVTLAYKNYPISRFAKADYGYDDANDFAKFLVAKAKAEGAVFAKRLAKTLSFEERIAVQKRFSMFREG